MLTDHIPAARILKEICKDPASCLLLKSHISDDLLLSLFQTVKTTEKTEKIWNEHYYREWRQDMFYNWSNQLIFNNSTTKVVPKDPESTQICAYLENSHQLSDETIVLYSNQQAFLFDYKSKCEHWYNGNYIIDLPMRNFNLKIAHNQLVAFLSATKDSACKSYDFLHRCDLFNMLHKIYGYLV
jgi:hypothetical protein